MTNQYQLQNAQLGANDWRSGVQQMLGAAGNTGQLSQDDWKAGQMLTGIGDAYQQNMQQQLNAAQGAWQQQNQYPAQMLDILRSALQASSGGFGTNAAQQSQGYQMNPITALLGGGAAAYGLLK